MRKLEMIERLEGLLEPLSMLFNDARNAHWNIRDSHSWDSLHKLFGSIYESACSDMDIVAELCRQEDFSVGIMPPEGESGFTRPMFDVDSALEAIDNDLSVIISSLGAVIELSAEKQKHAVNNALCDMIERYQKSLWVVRSHAN